MDLHNFWSWKSWKRGDTFWVNIPILDWVLSCVNHVVNRWICIIFGHGKVEKDGTPWINIQSLDWSLSRVNDAVNRAPGISVFEFHSQSKRERERDLRQLRRQGGVCLTSYGIIVNNAEQLATDVNGRDFVWVRVTSHTNLFTLLPFTVAVTGLEDANRLL